MPRCLVSCPLSSECGLDFQVNLHSISIFPSSLGSGFSLRAVRLQRYLAHKKHPPPYDHHRFLGIGLLYGPTGGLLLMREVSTYSFDASDAMLIDPAKCCPDVWYPVNPPPLDALQKSLQKCSLDVLYPVNQSPFMLSRCLLRNAPSMFGILSI